MKVRLDSIFSDNEVALGIVQAMPSLFLEYVICGEIEAMTAFLRQFMNSKNMCNHKRTISTSSDKKAVNFYILAILMTGEKYFFLLQWSLQFTQPVNLIRSATPLTPLHTPFPFFLFSKNLRFIATEVQAKQKSPFLLKTYKYGADLALILCVTSDHNKNVAHLFPNSSTKR